MRNKLILASIISVYAIFHCFYAYAGEDSPSNYNDCIIQSLKSSNNPMASLELKRACARKYPNTVPLSETDLIIYVVNSGELMKDSHYRAVYRKHYSDLKYDDYLKKIYEKKDRLKYSDISFEEFLRLIEYKKNK